MARAALAGAGAALVWAAFEPFGRRLVRTTYSDVALVGLPVHVANGALFGIAYDELLRRRGVGTVTAALAEHVALWPLVGVFHPRAARDPRAFASSGLSHAVFGLALAAFSRGARRA